MDINISIDDQVSRQLETAIELFGDLTPVFEDFGVWQDGETDDLFLNQKDPYDRFWWGLKEATLKRKSQRGEFSSILQATGKMRASTVSKAMKSGYRHGFTDRKAVFHDRAESDDRRRKLLPDEEQGLPPKSEAKLKQIIDRRLLRGR